MIDEMMIPPTVVELEVGPGVGLEAGPGVEFGAESDRVLGGHTGGDTVGLWKGRQDDPPRGR